MVPIERAAQRAIHTQLSSFEFPGEEINVSRDLDSKLVINSALAPAAASGASSMIRSEQTIELATDSLLTVWSFARRGSSQPAKPATSDPLSAGFDLSSELRGRGDPLINELNRFRGLA
jgi:hypothetical protein